VTAPEKVTCNVVWPLAVPVPGVVPAQMEGVEPVELGQAVARSCALCVPPVPADWLDAALEVPPAPRRCNAAAAALTLPATTRIPMMEISSKNHPSTL